MHRALYVLAPTALTVALAAAFTVGDAVSDPATAEATATQYTVTRTIGPFNGALPPGATVPCVPANPNCAMSAPGSIDPDKDAPTVECNSAHDALLGGSAVINTKTPGHPAAKSATVDLDRLGALWDSDQNRIEWGTFIRPNGRAGWSSVTISAVCLVRK